jgi:predicted AAA+ superfamily ATPase
MDRGGVELFVTGSSAKLLSREVATSLRGRAMEVLVHPFSFREALRHAGAEPQQPISRQRPADRAALDRQLRRYLAEGGFPEAQGATPRDRAALLAGYVDVVVLRDVIERHAVSNPLARISHQGSSRDRANARRSWLARKSEPAGRLAAC